MTRYNPLDILMELVRTNFATGRNNSSAPIKGGKRADHIVDWEGNPSKPLPSIEFQYQARKDVIRSLNTACRYTTEDVRLSVRSETSKECWAIGTHLFDDILIPQSKNFTTLTKFSNMEYNFLEAISSFDVNEYADDVLFYRMDILVKLHRPKVHTIA